VGDLITGFQHRAACRDPETGKTVCVCGLDDALLELAEQQAHEQAEAEEIASQREWDARGAEIAEKNWDADYDNERFDLSEWDDDL
jgi:hypothetical protein